MKDLSKVSNSVSSFNKEIQDGLNEAYEQVVAMLGEQEAKKELGFAIQIISKSKELQKCSTQSIIDSVINVGRTKISLNPALKLAFLIPRAENCTLDFSYMGLISILKKSGSIKYMDAFCVYEDEAFEHNPSMGTLSHTPYYATTEKEQKARKIIGVYSRAVLPTNDVVYCYMPMWEVNKVRGMVKTSGEKWSLWNIWEEEMIKKTAIRRHFKTLINGNELEFVSEMIRIEEQNNPISNNFTKKSSLFDIDFD